MILGFAHPGLVVPDLERARDFYERMFGFRYFCDEGWSENEVADRIIGLAGSSCRGVTLAGHNCYLELFEFSAPPQRNVTDATAGPQECGIRHLCFYVDDCRAEYQRLLELGGEMLGEPTDIGGGAYTVYCRDPFGNIIELAEIPTKEEDPRNLPGVDSLGTYSGTGMMFSLTGKRAFVTGGTSGIGKAVAKAFIAQGADAVVADITDGASIADSMGAGFVHVDVSNEASVGAAVEAAVNLLGGKLDIVVLNAGVGDVGPTLEETSQALIDKVTRINHWGVLYGLKHAPKHMNDDGSIISTSSMAAFISVPGSGVYSAGKRAVVSMTEMSALELGARGIRVNTVCPGYTATALGSGEEGQKICEAFTALGRVATVDDMAGVYVFLASDASRYMTGQALKVDGGWECGPTARLLEMVTGNSEAPA